MTQNEITPLITGSLPGVEPREQRLALMRELACSLEQAQAALVRSDVAAMAECNARQEAICDAIRNLENSGPVASASAVARVRWENIGKDLSEVEGRVRELNRVYGALLRRAGRTLDIFLRVLASSAVTYAPPLAGPRLPKPTFALEEGAHV
jgi:hypothetical protein